ncbi:hypothetical protein KP509_02G064100 [Ceratopteris richardii]|uniref:Uncharacterized protein n=1 Tax=Ceratopteris richardii TaxID=49495 RepID=A0A8T2VAI8_CERRI|nr:hypothetical protein KP509_02G064100 [Ceratopteris richardii]
MLARKASHGINVGIGMEVFGMNFTCLVDSLQYFRFPTQACVLPLFSQILGYAIVVASSIVKLPQNQILLCVG